MTEMNAAGMSVAASPIMAGLSSQGPAIWIDSDRVLARAVNSAEELSPYEWYAKSRRGEPLPRADWWLISSHAAPVNVTAAMKSVPATFFATNVAGQFVGVADESLWSLNVRTRKVTKLASGLPRGADVVWPRALDGAYRAISELIVAGRDKDGAQPLVRVVLGEHGAASRSTRSSSSAVKVVPLTPPSAGARFDDYFPERSLVTLRDLAPTGTFLWGLDTSSGQSTKLLALNEHLADIALGEPTIIDYRGVDGQPLKGGVLLPPDYQPGRKYPVLMWVYAGSMVRGPNDSSFSVYAPGQYNLRLYAARGYVVLMPSMPLKPDGGKNDDYIDLPKGALPALNRLIDLGIADPERLAVMGQSYGGFSVYSLVTYTNRFKAAIAMAGITDLVSLYGEFDRTARGYPGIEHQKSVNWGLAEQGQVSMGVPPWEDLWRYLRNSPINFVDRVQTPLLLIHGDQDVRGPITQAEEFFYALYRQGKRAKLLRYWGEDHGLRQSPANVREIVDEIFAWLKLNMPETAAATKAGESPPSAQAAQAR
jgi:dipeptidyl aminopeptidase/acylaminoacyl peptidase